MEWCIFSFKDLVRYFTIQTIVLLINESPKTSQLMV